MMMTWIRVIAKFVFVFFLRFYLFIHERHTESGRDIGRGRSKLPVRRLIQDSISDPGSQPEPKADTLNC